MTAPARFKNLCLNAVDTTTMLRFWSTVLSLEVTRRPDQAWLSGRTPQHTVWIKEVSEPKTVKNRVHLDVHCGSLAELQRLGAQVLEEHHGWTVFADPEGGEFCAFVRDQAPDYRLMEVVVDCVDAAAQAAWWARAFGVAPQHDEDDPWWWIEPSGSPFEAMVFNPVPEPKSAPNRVHWDVTVESLVPLLAAGATSLRTKGDGVDWHVLADPEGNEFCAFDAAD